MNGDMFIKVFFLKYSIACCVIFLQKLWTNGNIFNVMFSFSFPLPSPLSLGDIKLILLFAG